MKRIYYLTLCVLTLFFLNCTCVSASCKQLTDTLEIGLLSTTHVLFMSDLSYVDVSTPDCVTVKVVEASKNMIAMKARKEFDSVRTISALEVNGTMHTFFVKYAENPSNLVVDTRVKTVSPKSIPVESERKSFKKSRGKKKDFELGEDTSLPSGLNVTSSESSNFGRNDAPSLKDVCALEQKLYHIGDMNFGISVCCINILVYSNLTYLVFRVENKSNIGFEAGDAQFNIESSRKQRRTLVTDRTVWAKSTYGSFSCAPHDSSVVGYTIPKLTLLKGECLKVYIYEKSGNRNVVLTMSDKDINLAMSKKGR